MDLTLSEEQEMIVGMVRRFVREEIVPLELGLDLTSAAPPDSRALAFSLPTGLAVTTELLSEDVEGALPGWTVETPDGPASWSTSNARSSSPDRSWHVDDPAASGETWLRMPTLPDDSQANVTAALATLVT